MMGKRVRRPAYICTSEVYDLCNKYHWFTAGGTEAYEKMFSLVREGRPLNEIALAIWICSSGVSLGDINNILDEALYVEEENQ